MKNLTNTQLARIYSCYMTEAKIRGQKTRLKEIINTAKLQSEIVERFLKEYLPPDEEE